jgi:formylglycine-generating enzyme required for sulfatase activity
VAEGNPDFREVQQKLVQARDGLQCAQWYDEAIVHAEAQRWADASRIWIKVLRGRPDYHGGDAAARLLTATEGLLGQFDEAVGHLTRTTHDVKDLQDALNLYDRLALVKERGDWLDVAALAEQLLKQASHLLQPPVWLATARFEMQQIEERSKVPVIQPSFHHSVAEERSKAPIPQQPFREDVAIGSNADHLMRLLDGSEVTRFPTDKEMVRVPAGEFIYGNQHEKIHLPEFWIDKAPVTNAEYARFVAAKRYDPPRHWQGQTPPSEIVNHPVINVSWNDAVAYAKWAGKHLPTEQEWEKAARGTDGRAYPWGNQQPNEQLCNFGRNTGGTTPVGKYSPEGDSPYGCVDMIGNVWEWTTSPYDSNSKVLRGGSWYDFAVIARTAPRGNFIPTERNDYLGFRCVAASLEQAEGHLKVPVSQESPRESIPIESNADRQARLANVKDMARVPTGGISQSGQNRKVKLDDFRKVTKLLGADRLTWLNDGKEMVRIPAGEFFYSDKRQKTILPEFWIDKTPVTNGEYARFVMATSQIAPSHWRGPTPSKQIANHPVVYVSWEDAIAYARWAGKWLPTEQEWEKAARGIDGRIYPWGEKPPTDKLCNFDQNTKATTPVGRYSPQGDSPYGCVDMSGNVWEWTMSDYDNLSKVLRGGSWFYGVDGVSTTFRFGGASVSRLSSIGFRCVVVVGE